MKRTLCASGLVVLTVMSAACSFKIFEDVGSDPHPPTVAVIGLGIFVPPVIEPEPLPEPPSEPPPEPAPDRAVSAPQARATSWDSRGFTLTTGELFLIATSYTDAGGDIVKLRLRDRDGSFNADLTPPEDSTYFPGTSGTITHAKDGLTLTGILGPHRLELWAEDSHGSRSEKVDFIITLVP